MLSTFINFLADLEHVEGYLTNLCVDLVRKDCVVNEKVIESHHAVKFMAFYHARQPRIVRERACLHLRLLLYIIGKLLRRDSLRSKELVNAI